MGHARGTRRKWDHIDPRRCASDRGLTDSTSLRPSDGRSVDSNTFDYTSGGVHVIQRLTPGNDVVALRLYLLGGVLQLTPATAGVEELALRTLPYGSARYPGPASRRAFARTGSQWHENSGSDWSTVGFVSITDRFDSAWAVFGDRIAYSDSRFRLDCFDAISDDP